MPPGMARPLRRDVRDGWYHVFHRGTERGAIFGDEREREHFLELLAGVSKQYFLRIHAYVLMDGHALPPGGADAGSESEPGDAVVASESCGLVQRAASADPRIRRWRDQVERALRVAT